MSKPSVEIEVLKPELIPAREASASSWLKQAADSDIVELIEETKNSAKSRHADTTMRTYDYWWSRFQDWCENPDVRYRAKSAPSLDVQDILPFDEDSEKILSLWLHDIFLGPTDSSEDWLGSPSPGTYSTIMSALKARTGDYSGVKWTPSTPMGTVLLGLRKKARKLYGKDRQAKPLLAEHCAKIAESLSKETEEQLRDRLLVLLTARGLKPGDIGRILESNVDFENRVFTVPGQKRKGGKRDADKVVSFQEGSDLEITVVKYVKLTSEGSDEFFIKLSKNSRISHMRKCLESVAEKANVVWRSKRETPFFTAEEKSKMLLAVEGFSNETSLRRKRDLVMVWLGFFGALRRSELCALTIGDIEFSKTGVVLTIQKSKTDQDMQGYRLPVHDPEGEIPEYMQISKIVKAWVDFVSSLPGSNADTPLFFAVDRWGGVNVGADGLVPVGAQSWSERLKELAKEADLFDKKHEYNAVSGHSLRRGYVTSALLAGVEVTKVAKQTRHKNLNEIQRYADELELLKGTNIADIIVKTEVEGLSDKIFGEPK